MNINTWKSLEDEVYAHGKERMRHHGVFIHRFSDTRSAGNYIQSQPSDFLVLAQTGRAVFLEAKFSEAHESLRSCFAGSVSAQQLASARLVSRAGQDYRVLFFAKVSQSAELWDGTYLAECRSQGVRLDLAKRLVVGANLKQLLDTYVLRLRKFT
jgi:hypothetical protein